MASENLRNAKRNKNDEFYTMFNDIQNEVNAYLDYDENLFRGKIVLCPCDDPKWSNFTKFFAANFERFGLKKLISTSYALNSKQKKYANFRQFTLFPDEIESEAPQYNAKITDERGKKFVIERGVNNSGRLEISDIDNLDWEYLDGDGDFRSDEIKKLRDEADIIMTNPPFSLFREFMTWLMESEKKFSVIGNKNAVTYKEIFPLIKQNKIWLGARSMNKDFWLAVPDGSDYEKIDYHGKQVKHIMACWFTNIEHGRRHEPLLLMTYADNLRFSKHKDFKSRGGYLKYDNYDAIDVPYTDVIPDDYDGIMGVPVTYLGKHCPEQFEILGITQGRKDFSEESWPTKRYINPVQHNLNGKLTNGSKVNTGPTITVENPTGIYYTADNSDKKIEVLYARILIRKRKDFKMP